MVTGPDERERTKEDEKPSPSSVNPFTHVLCSPCGSVQVVLRPGRTCLVTSRVDRPGDGPRTPLATEGGRVTLDATLVSADGTWSVTSWKASLTVGARRTAMGRTPAATFRDVMLRWLTPELDRMARGFVEADLVELLRGRRRAERAIDDVRSEIVRRQDKLDDMVHAFENSGPTFERARRRLVGELRSLSQAGPGEGAL